MIIRMRTSEEGRTLIKRYEGVRLEAYLCPAGIWTIGVGHTGGGVTKGMKITMEQAEHFLTEDLFVAEGAVRRLVEVPLKQNQFDALVSFVFNLGEGNFKKSTLLRVINSTPNDYGKITTQFLRWNKAAGKILKGLTDRREDEAKLYCS